ncbi:cytochrome P450 [Pisolithus albus]|nr:cytochrome P450 [Pisolithus albus]
MLMGWVVDGSRRAFSHVKGDASIADVVAVGLAAVWVFHTAFHATGKKSKTTKLRGPKSNDPFFGVSKELFRSADMGGMYEAWAKEYGVAYEIPMICGERRIQLCDPRAAAHFFSKDTWSYVGIKGMKAAVARRMGKGLSYGEGESHRRYGSLWFDVPSPSIVFDVRKWVNYVSLDAFGIAGFSYDFNSLNGKPNAMISVLDSFAAGMPRSAFSVAVSRTPELCDALIDNANASRDTGENASTGDQFTAYATSLRTLLIASYETTAITMTWGLLELARYPNVQNKLREELLSFGEPLYDQITNDFRYLDAVVQEVLRLHPSVPELTREAAENNVIPLLEPVQTKSGEVVDSIVVERGTILSAPISCINLSDAIWGLDAKAFKPERWLEPNGITTKAQEVKGHRHMLTFGDCLRSCIGKTFALAEIKCLPSEIEFCRRYCRWQSGTFVLEMEDGPDTKVELSRGITLRPKVVGEDGIRAPLRIRQYKG